MTLLINYFSLCLISLLLIEFVDGSIVRSVGTKRSGPPEVFDFSGKLSMMDNILNALGQSSPMLVFRINNATVVSYAKEKELLTISYGAEPLNTLATPWQKLLCTGIAGDCRNTIRYAQTISVNHTFEYDIPPPSKYIAIKLSDYFQEATLQGGRRCLCCNCFILDASEGSIHKISANGDLLKVFGGCIGRKASIGETALIEKLQNNEEILSSPEKAKEIANEVMKLMIGNNNNDIFTKDITTIVIPDMKF